MEVLTNDLEVANVSYTAPKNTISLTYSVLDVLNNTYIQYDQLDAEVNPSKSLTLSIASPTVITSATHGLKTGEAIKFSTTGALPTGITVGTVYYVSVLTDNTFNIYRTSASSLIAATGTQSGTHTFTKQGTTSYTIPLSLDVCKYDRNILIEIQSVQIDNYSTDILNISLRRPYATVREIRDYFVISANTKILALSDALLEQMERKIRYSINSYINDNFNFEYKTVGSYGMNTDVLHLGQRIESFDKITYNDTVVYDSTEEPVIDDLSATLAVASSKYSLRVFEEGVNLTEWVDQNPIRNPSYFAKDAAYTVRGEYGWKQIPQDIKIAVYELINDAVCSDSIYLNKGIMSVQNDSFNIKFAEGMINSTGNLYVDGLLAPYKNWNLKAI